MLDRMLIVPKVVIRAQQLAGAVKLGGINKFRLDNKLSPANSVPPANITLTPGAPAVGASNYLIVRGGYGTQPGSVWIVLNPANSDHAQMLFAVAPGKTHLLDVALGPGDTQKYLYEGPKPLGAGQVKPEQGHLLIPFIPAFGGFAVTISPTTNLGQFISAELTQLA